jgi:predicted nucleic acid-binding protein
MPVPRPGGSPQLDAVLDTSVLYPKSIRGLLVFSAAADAYRPGWSEPILSELRHNLRERMAPGAWQQLEGTLRSGFPDAMVDTGGIRAIEAEMPNDPKDRHVLAAAVVAGAPVVVTSNLKHFRDVDLEPLGVRAVSPDRFLTSLLEQRPAATRDALSQQAAVMGPRGWSEGQLLGHLAGLGRARPMAPSFARAAQMHLGIRAVAPPVPEAGHTIARPRAMAQARGWER